MAPHGQHKNRAYKRGLTGSTVDWESILRLATGCENDYITGSENGVRLEGIGSGAPQDVFDPVTILQEGLPVLFHVSGSGFQQRILRVDNKLNFCYLMSVGTRVDRSNIVVIPLHQVKVYGHAEALSLCKTRGINDPNMTCDSTVAIELTMHDQRDDGPEVLVFIAPSRSRLKESLEICCSMRQKETQKVRQGGGDMDVQRLDGVRFRDPLGLYKEPKFLDLELQFLSQTGHPGGRLGQHKLKLPLQLKRCPEEIQRVQDRGNKLTPVDRARVLYVLREMSTTHNWARSFKRLFQEDFYSFVNSPLVTRNVQGSGDASETQEDTLEFVSQETIDHVCQTPNLPDEDYYSTVFIRGLLTALRQSLQLHNAMVTQRKKLNALEAQINELPAEVAAQRREAIARRVAERSAAYPSGSAYSSEATSGEEEPGAVSPRLRLDAVPEVASPSASSGLSTPVVGVTKPPPSGAK